MMYKVILEFADLQDSSHVYSKGDSYPRDGVKPSAERISSLLSGNNKIGKPLIEEIKEKKPAKAERKPKKAE